MAAGTQAIAGLGVYSSGDEKLLQGFQQRLLW